MIDSKITLSKEPENEVCHITGKPVKTNYSTKTPYQFIVNQFKQSGKYLVFIINRYYIDF